MEIITYIRLVNNSYEVELDLAEGGLTPVEKEAIANYGEPVITAGGLFDAGGGGLSYTLGDDDRKFPSQFPVKKTFSRADYPSDANDRAVLYRTTLKTRLDTAMTALRSRAAGTTGREIDNIDTAP